MSEKSVNNGQFVNNVSSQEGKEKVMKVPFAFKMYFTPSPYDDRGGWQYGVALEIEEEVTDEPNAMVYVWGKAIWTHAERLVPLKSLPVRQVAGKKYVVTKQGLLDFTGVMHSEAAVMAPPVRDIPEPTEFMRPGKATGGRRDNTPVPRHPSEMTEEELKAAGWRTRAPKA